MAMSAGLRVHFDRLSTIFLDVTELKFKYLMLLDSIFCLFTERGIYHRPNFGNYLFLVEK